MRAITDHQVNGLNKDLHITVIDDPGAGGANHRYDIEGFDSTENPSSGGGQSRFNRTVILFQNGPLQEVGKANGISQEALLVIVIDRLRSFQAGPYACHENAIALINCEQALMWLQKRTLDRLRRGVEGTSTK